MLNIFPILVFGLGMKQDFFALFFAARGDELKGEEITHGSQEELL